MTRPSRHTEGTVAAAVDRSGRGNTHLDVSHVVLRGRRPWPLDDRNSFLPAAESSGAWKCGIIPCAVGGDIRVTH